MYIFHDRRSKSSLARLEAATGENTFEMRTPPRLACTVIYCHRFDLVLAEEEEVATVIILRSKRFRRS